MTHLQIIATLGAVALLLIVLELVRRRRLLERYALVWLAVAVALVILGAWGGLLQRISDTIGVAAPANALFAIGLGFLIVLVLNFSVAVSRLTDQSKVLAQRLALLEERLRRQERLAEDAAAEPDREPLSS
jgi:hypothetical protein